MDTYLTLFEDALVEQTKILGEELAYSQATQAGLVISDRGGVVGCEGDPQLVLLRLIKHFTKGGNLAAMLACTPLIDLLTKEISENMESK